MASAFVAILIDALDTVAEAYEASEVEEVVEIGKALQAEKDAIEAEAQEAYEAETAEVAAQQAAVNTAYESISNINLDAANEWSAEQATNTAVDAEANPGTGDFYETEEPEDNPDMGDQEKVKDPDDPDDPDDDISCNGDEPDATMLGAGGENEECTKAKEKNTKKYWRWMKNSGRWIVRVLGWLIVPLIAFLIGQFARWTCQLLCSIRGRCRKDSKGKCGECQNFKCSCDTYCTPRSCKQVKNFLKTLRRYWTIIVLAFVILSALLIFFFRSISLSVFLLIVLGVLWLCKSWAGNAVATMSCNWAATTNLFRCGDVVCNR